MEWAGLLRFSISIALPFVRQCKEKNRTLVRFAFGPDPATVPGDDAVHIGQADAGALEFIHMVQSLEHTEQLN